MQAQYFWTAPPCTSIKSFLFITNAFVWPWTNTHEKWYTKNEYIHEESNIPTIREYANKLSQNFYDSASSHSSLLINKLGDYSRANLILGWNIVSPKLSSPRTN